MDLSVSLRQGEEVRDSAWLTWLTRLGLVAYGVVHLLIAWLALQLAFGNQTQAANQQGALHALAQQMFGEVLLWLVALGLFALALWQITQVIWGYQYEEGAKRVLKRVGSAGRVVVYAAIGYSAVKIAIGAGSHSKSQQWTSRLMAQEFGRLLVALVGIVVLVIAGVHAKRGITKSFTKDLEGGATSGTSGTAIVRLGQVGYLAKAVAFGVVGALFIWAAWTYDAKKAGGLDQALATLRGAAAGPFLLAVVAIGIGCFGLYCFGWARYPRTDR
jgi:hypothetical protein